MTRRGFFGTLLAAVAAPFVPKPVTPVLGLQFHRDAFALVMEPLGEPFATNRAWDDVMRKGTVVMVHMPERFKTNHNHSCRILSA